MSSSKSLEKKLKAVGSRLLPILNFAGEVANKIPTAEDTWLQIAVKALAVGNSAYQQYVKGATPIEKAFAAHDPVKLQSELLVNLFFSSEVGADYQMSVHPLDNTLQVVEAVGDEGDRLFFVKYSYGGGVYESEYYAGAAGISGASSVEAMVRRFWRHYRTGVYISVTREPGSYRNEYTVCAVPSVSPERLSSAARAQLDALSSRHVHYVGAGVHRTYLCLGPPGTGKTTFAALFGARFGGRTLKLDATSLRLIGAKDLSNLLQTLKPNLLVVEDMDRADMKEASPRVLFLMERLKAFHPEVTVLITVNDPTKLDSALLRSGRIDVPLVFGLPQEEELDQMVGSLLSVYGVDPEAKGAVLKAITTDSLSHAYVADLCQRLRYEKVDEVLESVRLLRSLANKTEEEGKKPSA